MNPPAQRILVARRQGEFVEFAVRAIRNALKPPGDRTFRLGLAGGSTPIPVYKGLAQLPANDSPAWDRVEFFFGDERCVPPDHQDSNFRLAEDALFRPLRDRIAPDAIHPMEADRPDGAVAVSEYDAKVSGPPLDLLILGMGEDGHTCSLFPHSPSLDAKGFCTRIDDSPKPPLCRMTLTPRAILAARELLVLVRGEEKAEALGRALDESTSPHEIPARFALHGLWIVDGPAASSLDLAL